MKKNIIGVVVIVVIIAILCGLGYYLSYPINFEKTDVESYLESHIEDTRSEFLDVKLYDEIEIANTKFVSMEVDGNIGYAKFESNLFGKYKQDSLNYGGGDFSNGIVNIDGKNYLMFLGRNKENKIAKAVFSLENNQKIEIDVPNKDVFFIYSPVGSDVKELVVYLDNIKLFNASGEDITGTVNLSGGDIR